MCPFQVSPFFAWFLCDVGAPTKRTRRLKGIRRPGFLLCFVSLCCGSELPSRLRTHVMLSCTRVCLYDCRPPQIREPASDSVAKPKNCSICLYPFKPRQRVRIIPCLHQFHTEVSAETVFIYFFGDVSSWTYFGNAVRNAYTLDRVLFNILRSILHLR